MLVRMLSENASLGPRTVFSFSLTPMLRFSNPRVSTMIADASLSINTAVWPSVIASITLFQSVSVLASLTANMFSIANFVSDPWAPSRTPFLIPDRRMKSLILLPSAIPLMNAAAAGTRPPSIKRLIIKSGLISLRNSLYMRSMLISIDASTGFF